MVTIEKLVGDCPILREIFIKANDMGMPIKIIDIKTNEFSVLEAKLDYALIRFLNEDNQKIICIHPYGSNMGYMLKEE